MVIHVNSKNFNSEIMETDKKVLIDFWAPWCGPCKMIGPVLDELAKEVPSDVKIVKINVDEEQELASQFRVFSIPTLFVVKDKKVVKQAVGYQPKDALKKLLDI